MGTDTFEDLTEGLDSPYVKAAAITPHNTNELTTYTRAIYVGASGNISMTLVDDSSPVTFVAAQTGAILKVRAKIVRATGTTATSLIALV
jgi:hypothetical protein